jgi:hypothetical protein
MPEVISMKVRVVIRDVGGVIQVAVLAANKAPFGRVLFVAILGLLFLMFTYDHERSD